MFNALDVLYLPVLAVALPRLLRKKRGGWKQRFGRIEPLPAPASGKKRILLHAVSVGEVGLLRGLVDALRDEYDVVVSATTDTGLARAESLYAGKAHVVRYPLDFSWAVARFLRTVRPDVVGLVELELWPNFLKACRRRRIPVAVLNGRLSERSFKGYYRVAWLVRGCFRSVAFAAVQSEAYAERFRALGVPGAKCGVLGSMKWDAAPISEHVDGADALAARLGIDRTKPLVVAGSTAPDEHALLRDALPAGAQLVCAPRKPEWFDGAAADLPGCVRWSQQGGGDPASGLFLLDTIGVLRAAYSLADVVVVGRSFGGLYGSDPMEPAALGKPIVIGPAIDDFREAVAALREAGGLAQVDREHLAAELASLLADAGRRRTMGARAQACVREHQGATARHAAMLRSLVDGAAAKEHKQ